MKYFSMFSGIGYGIMEVWKEKNTNENISRLGESVTPSVFVKWNENGGTRKAQSKRLRKLLRIKRDGKGLELKQLLTTVVSVPVVESQR